MCGLLISLWSITVLIEHLLVVFLFLEGTWSDTFYFWFLWHLGCFLLCSTRGSGASFVLGAVLVDPIFVTSTHPFSPLTWGVAFFRRLFSVSSRVLIYHPCPLQCFNLTSLVERLLSASLLPLFFEVACFLALIWSNYFIMSFSEHPFLLGGGWWPCEQLGPGLLV